MELLDDVCHMEPRFGPFRNSVCFGARYVHGLRLMHHSLRNHFGSTCCLEINLDASNGNPRCRVSYGILLWSICRHCKF
jgi:hypothetical protein